MRHGGHCSWCVAVIHKHVLAPDLSCWKVLRATAVPGVIICEGAEEDAAEFVHRLRELRWKVRACNCHVALR